MPYYEFECDNCGVVRELFFRSIPRVVPTHEEMYCSCVEKICSHKKILSLHAFHLKGGKVPWGEDRFSSASAKGGDPVSIDENP